MFSSSSPAATGVFRPAAAAETAAPFEAAPSSADAGRASFGDALSAAVVTDDADGEAADASANPGHAANPVAVGAQPSSHGPAVGSAAGESGTKNRPAAVRAGVADSDTTKDGKTTVTIVDSAASVLAALVPALARPCLSGATLGAGADAPGLESTGAGEQQTAMLQARRETLAAVAGRLAQLVPSAEHADAGDAQPAIESHDITSDALERLAASGDPVTILQAAMKGRAAAIERDLPAAFSSTVRNWRDAQFTPTSATSSQPSAASAKPVESAANPQVAAAPRETAAGVLLQQSLTARMVTVSGMSSSAAMLDATGAPAEASALPPSAAEQMIEAIRLQWNAGGGIARIQLEPVHFGELTVSVRVDQGQVTARLEAANPAVREWLQANHALLRGGLAEHHLTLSRLEIGEPPEAHDAERRRQQQAPPDQGRRSRRSPRPDTGERFEVVA